MNNKTVSANIFNFVKDYVIDLYKTIFFIITSKRFKIDIFLASSFVFFFVRYILQMAYEPGFISADSLGEIKFYTAVGHWALTGAINLTIGRKVFHNKAVNVFITCITLFMLWRIFAMIMDITVISALQGTDRRYLSISAFYCSLFFTARIMRAYHLEEQIAKYIVVNLGTAMVMMFIVHFPEFDIPAFLSSSINILNSGGRYRFAFGMGHVNTAGGHAFHFLMSFAIYREYFIESHRSRLDAVYTYTKFLCLVVIIILLATASRAAITGIVGFWMVYVTEKNYSKITANAKLLMIYLMIMIAVMLIIFVDWERVYELSNRAGNYVAPILTRMTLNNWLFGMGQFGFFDNFYLTTIVSSGLVGAFFMFTAVFYLGFDYLKNISRMTKIQMLVSAMIVASMYRALFETFLANQDTGAFAVWIFALACVVDNTNRKRRMRLRN